MPEVLPSRVRIVPRAVLAAWVIALAGDGAAQAPCGRAGRPWVALAFSGEHWPKELREATAAHLRAGLLLRGIDVCALGTLGSEPPLALIELGSRSAERVAVGIDVHDAVTEKRVLRDVDLREVFAEGRSLTLAQAAEELLRASWAELAIEDARAPAKAPPVEVARAVAPAEPRPSWGPARDLGARFAMQHHGGGQTLLGADLFLSLWLARRFGTELAIGAGKGLDADARHGRVGSNALTSELALLFALAPRRTGYDLLAKAGLQLCRLQLSGEAGANTTARARAGLGVQARLSLSARAALWRALRLHVELGPGAPLRALTARDTGQRVTGTSGIELHAAVGIGAAF